MKPTTDAYGRPKAEMTPRMVDRDIDLKAVAITVGGIAGLTLLAVLTMGWLLSWFLAGAEAADPPTAPAVAAAPRELPAGPRLQASPEQHWDRMRAREEAILSSWGRTADGRVRIPIERAIEVLAAGGSALELAGTEVVPGEAGAAGEGVDPHAGHQHDDPSPPAGDAAAGEGLR